MLSWFTDRSTNISAKTAESYGEIIEKHLIPALGKLTLAKRAPVHIQKYYGDALEGGRLQRVKVPKSEMEVAAIDDVAAVIEAPK